MWKVLLFRRSGTVQELKIGSRARLVWNKNCHFLVVWSLVNVLASPCFLTCKWNNSIYCHSTVQSLSRVWLFVTPWTVACQASLFTTNSSSLLKLMSIESVMPFNHLILCYRLLLPPSIFPDIRVFSSESVLHIRWPKYWSFSISPSNEYSGLISFRADWLDLLGGMIFPLKGIIPFTWECQSGFQ